MAEVEVDESVVHLRRLVDAAWLGNRERFDDLRDAIIGLRDSIHGDEESTLREMYGPIGALGRLIQEREDMVDREEIEKWNLRWIPALERASNFLRRAQSLG